MKITAITLQKRDPNRVNVAVDGGYKFSLDIYQLAELGIKVGDVVDDDRLEALEEESHFGKAYTKAVDYCLLRPHSAREIKDYLYRKTMARRDRTGQLRPGLSIDITNRVFARLVDKGYVDDQKFAAFWIENRRLKRGISQRRLLDELRIKGVSSEIAKALLFESGRNDATELRKLITKKQSQYKDETKLMAYLARQGFSYDDIKQALRDDT